MFVSPVQPMQTSLPELMGAFSFALDLTEGQPEGHSLRACSIATAVARALGIEGDELRTVYYTAMLKDLGCSSNAARVAETYLADDRSFKHDFKLIGDGIGPALRFVFAKTGRGQPLPRRAGAILKILRNGPQIVDGMIAARCTRGAEIARLLRFPEAVAEAIYHLDEHWDGGGRPDHLSRDAIPLASRIALLAQVADVFFINAGPDAAREEVARLSGSWLDPELCRHFEQVSRERSYWQSLCADSLPERIGNLIPAEAAMAVDEDFLDDITAAFGQVIDAKSPYTGGHSERVGDYATLLGRTMGMTAAPLRKLRRAAILHDVGKLGVSSTILEKPGKLDDDEWQVMRGHAGETARILSRIAPLQGMANIAAAHHERLDGKGYPLGLGASDLALEARIISTCDFFDALTADRPYRAALPADRALEIMESEAGRAIDPACLSALREVQL
ncbi:HD-GYP domain-containing protein [Croceicoccus mobilis]|uniref:Metal-dependent phosphohydrolase n=1 Tax=Croceicoccus mobilis TaxID=1703339 RepID=A0A916Z944_9SPHN|nr:HD-GYP domain-containing protein [Croceicoccus mobilis]GGD80995.1 metal-dependent phosphohydrolase [Croceicoccus mobilis]